MREMEVQAKALAGVIKSALAPIQEECRALASENHQLRGELEALAKRLDEMPEPRDGEKGDPGADGQDGQPGAAGKSAYDIAVELGFAGTATEWLESLKGERGRDGMNGQDGQSGADGERGEQGDSGADGIGISETLIDREGELIITLTDGTIKRVGAVVGRDGINGEKGAPGLQGDPGEDGADGERGKDADPEVIKAMISEILPAMVEKAQGELSERLETAIKEMPMPQDGKDADPETTRTMVLSEVSKAVSEIEIPQPEPVDYERLVDHIDKRVSEIPAPKDGASVTLEDVQPLVEDAVQKAVAEIPEPKDGRSVTLDDVAPMISEAIEKAVADIPAPADGKDGLGFDDLRFEYDGERTLSLVFERGEEVKEHAIKLSHPLDQGVWKPGTYEKGDGVTVGGSLWFAQRDTDKRPGHDNKDWRLAVKRGRDAKPAKPIREDEE